MKNAIAGQTAGSRGSRAETIARPSADLRLAFTLIELIVVIAIIGTLAALIIPITGALEKRKKISVAQAELAQMEAAIDDYKAKYGFYPPDNTNNVVTNQLYFELSGTTNNAVPGVGNPTFKTLDGSGQIDSNNINYFFRATGLANSSVGTRSTDEGSAAQNFLKGLSPRQIGQVDPTGNPLVKILICSVPWPENTASFPIALNHTVSPWRYNSSHPTNSPNSYDLWVDLMIGGKTNRISNWNKQPQIVY